MELVNVKNLEDDQPGLAEISLVLDLVIANSMQGHLTMKWEPTKHYLSIVARLQLFIFNPWDKNCEKNC